MVSKCSNFTEAVANKLNANDLSRFKVSGVISAISPRNEWNKNKLDAENLCKEFVSNKYYQLPLFDADYHTLLKTKVSTFNTNKSKAVKILLNDDSKIESILKGNKIVNFLNVSMETVTQFVSTGMLLILHVIEFQHFQKFPQFQISIIRSSQTSTETLKTLSIRDMV